MYFIQHFQSHGLNVMSNVLKIAAAFEGQICGHIEDRKQNDPKKAVAVQFTAGHNLKNNSPITIF